MVINFFRGLKDDARSASQVIIKSRKQFVKRKQKHATEARARSGKFRKKVRTVRRNIKEAGGLIVDPLAGTGSSFNVGQKNPFRLKK